MTATTHYEIEYRAGDRWFPARDWNGQVEHYADLSAAYDALARATAGVRPLACRIVSVDIYRHELPIPPSTKEE